jgi:glutamyl-tRNA reductase
VPRPPTTRSGAPHGGLRRGYLPTKLDTSCLPGAGPPDQKGRFALPVVAFGFSHRTASLPLLERVSLGGDAIGKVLGQLCEAESVQGAVVLSTCNRTELYLDVERFHDSYEIARDVLADHSGLDRAEVGDHLAVYYDTEAVEHLFSVAAGLDSAVIGEHEILGQVRRAWQFARDEDAVTPTIDLLFRHAVEAGKRARAETAIGRGTASVGQLAVELAEARLGGLRGRRVVVVGAGAIATTVASALEARGVGTLVVANRSPRRAQELAANHGGRPVGLGAVPAELSGTDLVVSCTGAPDLVLEAAVLEAAASGRVGGPLVVVDVALPRDVDPAAREVAGVELHDLDDLRRFADATLAERERAAAHARELVAVAVAAHLGERRARQAAPVVAGLRRWAEELRRVEVERHRSRLGTCDDAELEVVDALTRAIVNKLLHAPTLALKAGAGTPRGDRLVEAVGDLFGLDELSGLDA